MWDLKFALVCVPLLLGSMGCSTGSTRPTFDSREFSAEATQRILGWMIAGSPQADFVDAPGTAWVIAEAERLLVVCDFLDAEVVLSPDARVIRVTESELDELWETHGYDKTVSVTIRCIPHYRWSREALPDHLAISLHYVFGNMGAHKYEFAFWRDASGLPHVRQFLVSSS